MALGFVPLPLFFLPRTGTLTVTLGALTGSAAGLHGIEGTLSKTLGAVTATASGSLPIVGALTATLGSLTVSAVGLHGRTGAVTATLGALTLAATAGQGFHIEAAIGDGAVFGYGAPPLPFGSIDDPGEFGAFVLYRGADPLNLGAHEGLHYLLTAAPFDPDAEREFTGPPLPFGEAGDESGQAWTVLGDAPTIYPAATLSRSSEPDDVPSNTWVPGALVARINYAVDLFGGADPLTAGSAGAGVLRILDPAGDLDDLHRYSFDGTPISLKRGREDEPFKNWATVASLTSSNLMGDLNEREMNLRALAWQLETADLHGQVYAGTGGLEGERGGIVKPYAAGTVGNISPVLLSTTLLIWQTSYTSVRDITAVRDGGVDLTQGADHPTYAALAAATVAPGTYATCLARGLFRVGALPVKDITADVEGDNDAFGSIGFPHSRGQIARRIATRLGLARLSESSQFDFASLGAFENRQPAPVGFYWSRAITKAAALDEVMSGCMGWWTVRIDGRFALGQVEDPEIGSADFTMSYPVPGSGEARLGSPSIAATLPPRRATFVGWNRNYTPQPASQLALGLTASEVQRFGQETSWASAADLWTANAYPTSPAVFVGGANYRDEADARAEARRQQLLWSRPRSLYAVPATIDPFADVVGRKARVDNANRLGWGAAKRLFCCGLDAAESATLTMKMWG